MSNTTGRILKLHTYGESHGPSIGFILDGFPAGVKIDLDYIQFQLDRRKPGQSKISSARKESDIFQLQSGVKNGISLGTPISVLIPNVDSKSKDYDHLKDQYRPGHADYTIQEKYGVRDFRGGGRSSARETANWVAAGAFAQHLLMPLNIEVKAFVSSVGKIEMSKKNEDIDLNQIDKNIVRCPDEATAQKMIAEIEKVKKEGDSLGGIISCIIKNVPAGWGEPIFDKLHARLAQAMMGINAVKGFQYGSGFNASKMKGSEHNDILESDSRGAINSRTNNSGGILGGISNGQDIYFDVAFKPVATIMKNQSSVDSEGNSVDLKGKGRHDPCVVPRAVPIVDALASFILADFYLLSKISKI
jgi:chorismate synthase